MFSLWDNSSTGKRPDSNKLKRGHIATYHSRLRHTLVDKSQSIVHLDKDSSPNKVPRRTLTTAWRSCECKHTESVWSWGGQNNDQSSRKASSHFWFLILRESALFQREILNVQQHNALQADESNYGVPPPSFALRTKPNLNFCCCFQPLVQPKIFDSLNGMWLKFRMGCNKKAKNKPSLQGRRASK